MSSSQRPSPSTRLPTPRVVITNLINSFTSASLALPSSADAGDTRNPLTSLPQSHRALLVTLHVLFPSLVLPALDLLDRNLVTRVVLEPAASGDDGREADNPADDPALVRHHRSTARACDEAGTAADVQGSSPPFPSQAPPYHINRPQPLPAAFHLVRSVASTMSRRSHALATSISASTTYLVRLDAWNCTCANFAFEAFPAAAGTAATGEDLEDEVMDADVTEDSDRQGEEGGWQFGGLSLDGVGSGSVPCCKHLLSCLLSEQWGDALGKYVAEKRASREEMAGLVADM